MTGQKSPLAVLLFWSLLLVVSSEISCPIVARVVADPYLDKCYYLFTKKPMSWPDARDACLKQGMQMLKIPNEDIQKFIITLAKDAFWIGAREKDDRWVWYDGQPVDYNDRGTSLSLSYLKGWLNQKELCIVIAATRFAMLGSGTWRKRECSEPLHYVCELGESPQAEKNLTQLIRQSNRLSVRFRKMLGEGGKEVTAAPLKETLAFSSTQFGRHCETFVGCLVFNLHRTTKMCRLFALYNPEETQPSQGWILWKLDI